MGRSTLHSAFYSAAGNRFVLVDARGVRMDPASLDEERLVEDALGSEAFQELRLDGVLLCGRPRAGGDCRMLVFNRDGSRAEACGNGLRCVARFALENGLGRNEAGELRLEIETDAGPRSAVAQPTGGEIRDVRTGMGVPRVVGLAVALRTEEATLSADLMDMGNPHCVLWVDDVHGAPVATLGPELEHHERFPDRTNVVFAQVRRDVPASLTLRVWERGVGETAACGTGAAAAGAAAILRGLLSSPLPVHLPGGTLEIRWGAQASDELYVTGPVHALEFRPSRAR